MPLGMKPTKGYRKRQTPVWGEVEAPFGIASMTG